jgi:arylsulfatase A-like enzyme
VQRLVLVLALALAALTAPGCGPRPEAGDAPWTVVARPSEAESIALGLGRTSRHARQGSFELRSPRPVERLVFSLGVRAGRQAPGAARFAIQARRGGRWLPVFEEVLEPGAPGWHDRHVDLEGASRGATRFRFEAALEGTQPSARAAAFFGSPALLAHSRELQRPNVLFLLLDTLGGSYLGRAGEFEGVSPAIDAFLDASFWFRRAFAQYGATLTSTTSLLSGLYPLHHGIYGGRKLFDAHFDSLVSALAADGYFTAAVTEGGYVASGWGTSRGFDWYDNGPPQQGTTAGFAPRTFTKAQRWLEEHGRDTRFFLLVHTYEVHSPYLPRGQASQDVLERFSPPGTRRLPARWQVAAILTHNAGRGVISDADLLRMRAQYLATLYELDARIAELLARLEALGLDRDTLVVLLADHGEQFGERGKVTHGESLHDRVLHVPLAFRWPGHIEPGQSDAPVMLVDVLPTVFELVGLPAPAGVDGRSLAPWILRRPEAPQPRPAFSELRLSNAECERLELDPDCRLARYAVHAGRFKLISSQLPPGEALYDLEADPHELHDVAASHPEELARLRARLEDYLAGRGERPLPAPSDEPLEPALRERLEALGYLH